MNEIIYPSVTSVMSNSGCISNMQNLLIFSSVATKKIREYIGWKRYDTPHNKVEQGGWLLGNHIQDSDGNIVQTLVTDVLLATQCIGSSTYLEWPAIEDIRLQRRFFELKEAFNASNPQRNELVRVGWWHTHPNALPVFMSGTDLETQRNKFYNPHDYSVVLNPHRLIWKAYIGRDAIEVPAIMLIEETDFDYHNSGMRSRKKRHPRKRVTQKAKKMYRGQRKW